MRGMRAPGIGRKRALDIAPGEVTLFVRLLTKGAAAYELSKKFGAGPEWQHYTGTVAASATVQRAFAAYRGDKMNHTPVTLVRSGPGAKWVRFDGFASADQLLAELPALHASR